MTHFTEGDQRPCWQGPECAEVISADPIFVQSADTSSRASGEELMNQSGVGESSWFLLDESGQKLEATITAGVVTSAHGCASAASFTLQPKQPLPSGHYQLVMLAEPLRWRRAGDAPYTHFEGQQALVLYYRVP